MAIQSSSASRALLAAIFLCGCAVHPQVRIADEVGPDPTGLEEGGTHPGWGILRVFCDSQLSIPDEDPHHTNGAYEVVASSGRNVASVRENSSPQTALE